MNITKREKGIGIAGIAGLALLLCIQIYIRPAIDRTNTLKRVVPEKRKILAEMLTKSNEYNSLQKSIEQVNKKIANQPRDRKILSLIEAIQRECGLSKNVISMIPNTAAINDIYEKTSVEIKYEKLTWNQIIQFLLKIKSSDMLIGIRFVEIKRELQNPDALDLSIQLINLYNIEQN